MHGGAALQNPSPRTSQLLKDPVKHPLLGWVGRGEDESGEELITTLPSQPSPPLCSLLSFREREKGKAANLLSSKIISPQTHTVTLEWSIDKGKGEFTPPPWGGGEIHKAKKHKKQSPTSISPHPPDSFPQPAPGGSWVADMFTPLPQQKGGRLGWEMRSVRIVNKTEMPA